MPCTRTPPPLEPNGYEKQTMRLDVGCTATEHAVWRAVFGPRRVADAARLLLNMEAYRRGNIPLPKPRRDKPGK